MRHATSKCKAILHPDDMTRQSVNALRHHVESRGPGEALNDAVWLLLKAATSGKITEVTVTYFSQEA